MNKRIFLAHKIKLFLPLGLIALFFICIPTLQAEETTPLPDLQFVRMGNTLVAVDQVPLLTDVDATLPQEARVLEREIQLRKLAESQTQDLPQLVSQPLPETQKTESSRAALSHQSFFEDFDQEIVDPFRSAENFDNFLTRVLDFLDYNIAVYGEYDDNVFLVPDNKTSDFKTVLNQSLEIQYPMDKFYFEVLYAVNLDFYGRADETVDTQNANFRLSYYPFNKLSLAVSDQFVKAGNSTIATSIGDQTLALGFITNDVRTELEYELWEEGFFEMYWNYARVNFSNDNTKRFINRDVHTIDARLKQRITPVFSNYMGYRFKDVVFDEFALKDQESSILFYGMDYEFPGLATLFGELAYESKEFKNNGGSITIVPLNITIPFAERRSGDNNVNFLIGIESNYSRYNNISLTYHSRVLESSRPEFTQYLSKTFSLNKRSFLDNKTILFTSLFLEVQDFEDSDSFNLLFPDGDATTKIYASGITLRRILTDWLYFDLGYTYVRRTTDFPGEGSNNSRFRFGARATF